MSGFYCCLHGCFKHTSLLEIAFCVRYYIRGVIGGEDSIPVWCWEWARSGTVVGFGWRESIGQSGY